MESDEEPTSLVKPPPDMATGAGLRIGSAWSADGKEAAAAPVQEEPEAVEEVEAFPEVEFELEMEPEVVPRNCFRRRRARAGRRLKPVRLVAQPRRRRSLRVGGGAAASGRT